MLGTLKSLCKNVIWLDKNHETLSQSSNLSGFQASAQEEDIEKLTNTLTSKAWNLISLTSYDASNPSGVTIDDPAKIKAASRGMSFEFVNDGTMTSTGMFAGGFTSWKALFRIRNRNEQTGKSLHLDYQRIQ